MENKTLLPFASPNEDADLSFSINPQTNFPKTEALLFELRKQNEEMARLKEQAQKISSVSGEGFVLESFETFAKRWEEALSSISSLAKEGNFEEAFNELDAVSKVAVGFPSDDSFSSEKEAQLIVKSLRCRLEAIQIAKQKDSESIWNESHITGHYYSCLALPTTLEGEQGKNRIIDEARGFVYAYFAEICEKQKEDYKTFTAGLPHWKMALSEEAISKKTEEAKERFAKSFTICYNAQIEKAFSVEHDYERALELFRFRSLFEKEKLSLAPYRYAYDENEFKLYFSESEALGKDNNGFPPFIEGLVSKVKTPDDFEFQVLSHLLALPGITKERFEIMVSAIKPLSFELKIQLLSSSLSLGLAPLRAQGILRSIERSHPKSLDLEALAKPLLFIKEHLNDALLARFLPLLEDILRSPKAHKVIVKSNSLALHTLAGENQEMPRLAIGKAMKNSKVRAWGNGKYLCYLILGICLPIFLFVFASVFIYLFTDISANRASLYGLIPLFAIYVWVLSILYSWIGFDERGSAVMRKVLLGDALWKAVLSLLYFLTPSLYPALDRIRYTLLGFAFIESFLTFFLLKPKKKKVLIDYLLFGTNFIVSVVALTYMILDMMKGLV